MKQLGRLLLLLMFLAGVLLVFAGFIYSNESMMIAGLLVVVAMGFVLGKPDSRG